MAAATPPTPARSPRTIDSLAIAVVAWLILKALTTIALAAVQMIMTTASAATSGILIPAGFGGMAVGLLSSVLDCLTFEFVGFIFFVVLRRQGQWNTKAGCLPGLGALVIWLVVKFGLFTIGMLTGLAFPAESAGLKALQVGLSCVDNLTWVALIATGLWGLIHLRKP